MIKYNETVKYYRYKKYRKNLDICGTVHHHSINKNNQRDAACSLFLYYVLW